MTKNCPPSNMTVWKINIYSNRKYLLKCGQYKYIVYIYLFSFLFQCQCPDIVSYNPYYLILGTITVFTLFILGAKKNQTILNK